MAQSYKNNFITGAQSMYRNEFCEKSFSSWDFAITGEKSLKNKYEANSSQLKVRSIITLIPSCFSKIFLTKNLIYTFLTPGIDTAVRFYEKERSG